MTSSRRDFLFIVSGLLTGSATRAFANDRSSGVRTRGTSPRPSPSPASPLGGAFGVSLSTARPAQGAALLLTCRTPPAGELIATFAGHTFPFYPGTTPGAARAILGADLELEPGPREITISSAATPPVTQVVPVTVRKGDFTVQRLKVAEKMVHPDPEAERRIAREAAVLDAIFKGVTPRLFAGKFLRPVPGHETASFGGRRVFNGVPKSPHSGVDMHADTGTPVKAPAAGRVVLVADHYFTGNTIVLDHGLGLFTQYAHLSAFSVLEGLVLKPGQVIGKVGATGRVTGPHLHWAARVSGARVNPLDLTKLEL